MGQEITSSHFTSSDFEHFAHQLELETQLLQCWFRDQTFSQQDLVGGYELEAWLLNNNYQPSSINQAFLDEAQSPLLSPELAQFNIELNTVPHTLNKYIFRDFARDYQSHWQFCQQVAERLDCHLLSIGILPTLEERHLTLDNISRMKRYYALNEQVLRHHQDKAFDFKLSGRQSLQSRYQNVMLEAASTSLQIHMQVPQAMAVPYYNAAILISAITVAVGANSPYLFGKDLWAETRIPVFEQAVNIGGFGGAAKGPLHRVSFGTGFARESLMECFSENQNHYPVLLPMKFESELRQMKHLSLHNGTIWRWNRPLLGFDAAGVPHLRIEHRVIASGPSIDDNIANMALFYGLAQFYANHETAPDKQMEFATARDNFYTAARHGIDDRISWPGCERCSIRHLVLNHLLDEAETGLNRLGIDRADIDYYLGIIEARMESQQTGSQWQRKFIEQHGPDMACMTQTYYANQQSHEPVHKWDYVSQ